MAKPRRDELVFCVIGAPAQASIKNKEAIIEAAREHVDSVMLCSEPFAVAYGLEMLEDVLVIDIGAGTADLCRMHGTMPEDADQLTIARAGDAIDVELSRLIEESCPGAQFTVQLQLSGQGCPVFCKKIIVYGSKVVVLVFYHFRFVKIFAPPVSGQC